MTKKKMASSMIVLTLIFLFSSPLVNGFAIRNVPSSLVRESRLFSTPRQPRRNLKKRQSRRDREEKNEQTDDFPWETAESRPLVTSKSIEYGEDYWIDERDLEKAQLREQAIKNRKALEGEIPKEKLWIEVFAPYKQNWIGIFSVVIVVLATLVTKFPELLNTPVIQIPDL